MPEEEHPTHKKRIKPVIEEISSDAPPPPESFEPQVVAEAEAAPVSNTSPTVLPSVLTPSSMASISSSKPSLGLGFFTLVAVVAAVVALFAGGVYVFLNGMETTSGATSTPFATPIVSSPSPSVVPTQSPVASPTVAPKLDVYKISVLNGSGKIGEAGKAKAMIEKAGFKVTNTGNAQSFNFTSTLIQVKAGVSAEVTSKLQDSLSAYKTEIGDALDAKSSYDIIVTVGKE